MAVRRIIVLVESQYQELELWYPLLRLREAGIEAKLVGINVEETFYGRHGFPARAEMAISLINARDFDGVIIPGGFAPDYLRRLPVVLNLVREFYQGGKLVAAISRGPWVLVSADIVRGKRIAGLVSIKDDVNNAGGDFTDLPVMVDGNIITAQGPDYLPFFMEEVLYFLWQNKLCLDRPSPDGWLTDTTGNTVLLSQLCRGKAGVILFFDSVFSPQGSQMLPSYLALKEEIEKKKGILIPISSDTFFAQREFIEQNNLPFPLWSDSSAQVIKAFGVWDRGYLARWAVFLVDRQGFLRYGEDCPGGDLDNLPGFRRKLESILG